MIAPRYMDRPGGYTRIVKVGFRRGDGAPMVLLEFVEGKEPDRLSSRKCRRRPKDAGDCSAWADATTDLTPLRSFPSAQAAENRPVEE